MDGQGMPQKSDHTTDFNGGAEGEACKMADSEQGWRNQQARL